uniref:Uncharacterized protein n=1 Tax=Coccolithus braarudii TaxID=221442 RepID=A0A7S0LNE4_9EUKA|mmetsp:Transcript_47823/g.102174  ORF Transcript_47823/g.102174 Transcript_47823/m.102174 type:complete len:119 (+) Transcript_47823:330-686(+)
MAARLRGMVPVLAVQTHWDKALARLTREGRMHDPLAIIVAIQSAFASAQSRARTDADKVQMNADQTPEQLLRPPTHAPPAAPHLRSGGASHPPRLTALAHAAEASAQPLQADDADAAL